MTPEEHARLEVEAARKLIEAEKAIKNQRVEQQLDLVIEADFPTASRLDQLLKHIKQETTKARPPGLPIYVDPLGLRDTHTQIGTTVAVSVQHKQGTVRAILQRGPRAGRPLVRGPRRVSDDRLENGDPRSGVFETIDRKLDRLIKAFDRLEKAK